MRYSVPLAISLSVHVLLFIMGGALLVKSAQVRVQVIPQSIQVDLEQMPPQAQPQPKIEKNIWAKASAVPKVKKKLIVKTLPRPIQSVVKMVQARADYFQNPPPEYPELAKQMRQEGLVLLSVDVDRNGSPIKVEIIKSSGFHMLDQAAFRAVSHWQFQPGRMGNLPVESVVTIPIRFTLEKEIT